MIQQHQYTVCQLFTPSGALPCTAPIQVLPYRSLSKSSTLYNAYNTEHDGPYWRGPIWCNVNFLALRALHHYSKVGGPHAVTAQHLHAELRSNLLQNLVSMKDMQMVLDSTTPEYAV